MTMDAPTLTIMAIVAGGCFTLGVAYATYTEEHATKNAIQLLHSALRNCNRVQTLGPELVIVQLVKMQIQEALKLLGEDPTT